MNILDMKCIYLSDYIESLSFLSVAVSYQIVIKNIVSLSLELYLMCFLNVSRIRMSHQLRNLIHSFTDNLIYGPFSWI